jgi:ubiquitin-conjugating enzyme E2 W
MYACPFPLRVPPDCCFENVIAIQREHFPTYLKATPLTHHPPQPIEAPEVTFVITPTTPKIPMHPHVYSNGIICLDLLDRQGWSPVHNVESVCMSLQSMLTGNEKNERPPDNEEFVRRNRLRPRDINFHFHDNTV